MTKTQSFLVSAFACVMMIFGAVALTAPAFAQFEAGDPSGALDSAIGGGNTAYATGDADTQVFNIIGRIINILLGLLGIVFFIYVLWAGFIWMTAQGEPTKVKKATDMLIQGTIGLLIILAAYAISNFAVSQLLTATTAA